MTGQEIQALNPMKQVPGVAIIREDDYICVVPPFLRRRVCDPYAAHRRINERAVVFFAKRENARRSGLLYNAKKQQVPRLLLFVWFCWFPECSYLSLNRWAKK